MTKEECYNEGVEELDVVTSVDSRPLYYQLAFIMRVE